MDGTASENPQPNFVGKILIFAACNVRCNVRRSLQSLYNEN